MKNYALLLLGVFMISCNEVPKKPPSLKKVGTENTSMEKNLLDKLSFQLINKPGQETFNEQCIPLIQKLYEEDPDKYKIVNIIGSKLSKEPNIQAYDMGYENLKKELNKLK